MYQHFLFTYHSHTDPKTTITKAYKMLSNCTRIFRKRLYPLTFCYWIFTTLIYYVMSISRFFITFINLNQTTVEIDDYYYKFTSEILVWIAVLPSKFMNVRFFSGQFLPVYIERRIYRKQKVIFAGDISL